MGTVERVDWGRTAAGREVGLWLVSAGDQQLRLVDLGARWIGWRAGAAELLLGPDSVAAVERDSCFVGATVGRFANRIARARFTIDGVEYQAPPNEGANLLHGGAEGLWTKIWDAEPVSAGEAVGVRFSTVSLAGDQGFPGTLKVAVTFLLDADGVRLEYRAISDARTVLNLTNHAYFNLAQAEGADDVASHLIQVAADQVVAVDEQSLPTGEFWPVTGSDFDLRTPRQVAVLRDSADPRIAASRGVDHCYVLDPDAEVAARLSAGARTLELRTDQPGLQVYLGQWLTGDWAELAGLCLETQGFPDAPNQPQFPSTLLDPGIEWHSTTSLRLV